MENLLSPLVTSNTRMRLLLRFFSNPGATSYLRELAGELEVSPNAVREELSRLSQAKLLNSFRKGREVRYQANEGHPLFRELTSIVRKILGIDRVVDNIVMELGDLQLALLMDDYARGRDSGIIDLVLMGNIKQKSVAALVAHTEGYIKRKIRTLCLTPEEYQRLKPVLVERPHLVLWDKRDQPAEARPAAGGEK
ncbi:MAG: winged helix-turn-helix domain-containing protein [Pseudomonadota bacterium]